MLCMAFYTFNVKLPYPQCKNVTQRTPDRLAGVLLFCFVIGYVIPDLLAAVSYVVEHS